MAFNGIAIAIDDTKTAGFHDTGAFYDLVKARINAMMPVGEWNKMEMFSKGSRIEITLNGEKVNAIDVEEWNKKNVRPNGTTHKFDVAFKDHPRKGHIGLQDHGSDCWYKNIKLKPLDGGN